MPEAFDMLIVCPSLDSTIRYVSSPMVISASTGTYSVSSAEATVISPVAFMPERTPLPAASNVSSTS